MSNDQQTYFGMSSEKKSQFGILFQKHFILYH